MSRKQKGRINLLSFDDDNEMEMGIDSEASLLPLTGVKKQQEVKTRDINYIENTQERIGLDLSQIKDRVLQMEINEEIVLDGEEAAQMLSSFYNETETNDNEDVLLEKRIKEAKERRTLMKNSSRVDYEVNDDFISLGSGTKGEYWMNRDTRESEESSFTSTSRLVREDLFNDRDDVDTKTEQMTQFIGKSVEGGKREGLMMTSKLLERDLRDYDLEISLEEEHEEHDEESGEKSQESIRWQHQQTKKGISGKGNESFIVNLQSRLEPFFPPKGVIKSFDFDTLGNITESSSAVQETELQNNLVKIQSDSKRVEERTEELLAVQSDLKENLMIISRLESFFRNYSTFVQEKMSEMDVIQQQADDTKDYSNVSLNVNVNVNNNNITSDILKHLFDDCEDEEYLNLPVILDKYFELKTRLNSISAESDERDQEIEFQNIKDILILFIRYHFVLSSLTTTTTTTTMSVKEVLESSGLQTIFDRINSVTVTEEFEPVKLLSEALKDYKSDEFIEELKKEFGLYDF